MLMQRLSCNYTKTTTSKRRPSPVALFFWSLGVDARIAAPLALGMASKSNSKLDFSLDAVIPKGVIDLWEADFKALGAQRFPRARQFALNRVAGSSFGQYPVGQPVRGAPVGGTRYRQAVTVSLRKNGTVVVSVNISSTTLAGFIAVNVAVAANDLLTMDVSSTDPGVAVDVTSMIQIQNAA